MSGATRDGPVRAVVGPPAAMEPARDERGDRVTLSQPLDVTVRPQWSPLAMSGATGDTEDGTDDHPRGRNGARSR